VSAASSQIDFSVIITLCDDRRHLEECISSWTQRQTFPRHRFEVIALGSRREADAAQAIMPLLGTPDRVIQHDIDNEMLLFDLGARQAQGKWLVFTEAHCAAEPDCLAQLSAFLMAHQQYIGACVRTADDGNRHPVASVEGRWYREGFEQWSQQGDWRKVTIHGTAIRRDIYESIGGFRSEFGCFAESLLAFDLHAAGYRLGYAEQAAVKHYNSTDVRDFLIYIREYCEGEVACQRHAGSEQLLNEEPQRWRDVDAADRMLAWRCAAQSFSRAAVHPLESGAASLARSMMEMLLQQGCDVVFGGRSELFGAFRAQAWARFRFALPGPDPDKNYRHFCQLLETTARLARVRALLNRPADSGARGGKAALTADGQISTAPSNCLFGFHAPEKFDGVAFRWSSPLALIRLELQPADHEVCIDTGAIAGPAPGRLEVYLNGHHLRAIAPWKSGKLKLSALRHHFLDKGHQKLVLTSGRVPTRGSTERRALGIPIRSVGFTPA
jgi:hypothetical protein